MNHSSPDQAPEMVERVARVLDPDAWADEFPSMGTIRKREATIDKARAAIEAMREPTLDMISQGFEAIRMEEKWPTMLDRVWRPMVTAASGSLSDGAKRTPTPSGV